MNGNTNIGIYLKKFPLINSIQAFELLEVRKEKKNYRRDLFNMINKIIKENPNLDKKNLKYDTLKRYFLNPTDISKKNADIYLPIFESCLAAILQKFKDELEADRTSLSDKIQNITNLIKMYNKKSYKHGNK